MSVILAVPPLLLQPRHGGNQLHHGNLETVDVLKNGSLRVSGSYEAVNLDEAATQAMPDDKLKGLLNWAISEFFQAILNYVAAACTILAHSTGF